MTSESPVETFKAHGNLTPIRRDLSETDLAAAGKATKSRHRTWLSILIYGILLFFVFSFFTMFEIIVTNGVCFVYTISYFLSFTVVLAIRRVGAFGTGAAVFLPYAILGFFMEYWFDYVETPRLIAGWAAAIWSLNGPLAGFAADLAHRHLPRTIKLQYRSAITGMILSFSYFLLTLLTLAFLYAKPDLTHYLNGIYFTLPWLLVSGCFGGYTAYAMSREAA